MVTTYFDTREHALARQGLVLRVRERDGRFVQTVKSEARGGGAAFARGEWEDEIGGAMPDPLAPQSGRFVPAEAAGRLVPLFRTEVNRRIVELSPAPDIRIEAAIDRGRIRTVSGDASEAIGEVELELKDGCPTALYDAALDLLRVAPARLEARSKAERGYRLTLSQPPLPEALHASPIELDPRLDGHVALQRIGRALVQQILGNEAAVLAGVADGIHQMRVAVRRLRAVLSAFGRMLPESRRCCCADELRWLADALAPARDLDVFMTALVAPARAALGDIPGINSLENAVERRRKAAYAEAAKAVRSPLFTGLVLALLRWFESQAWRADGSVQRLDAPIGKVAGRILDRRRRTVRRRAKRFARQSAERRHQLRIALKKQRYAIEALAGLYPADAIARFTRPLKRLQDDLGEANDLRVGRDIAVRLAQSKAGDIAAAADAVFGWHEHRLAEREPKLRQHLARLRDAEPFWSDGKKRDIGMVSGVETASARGADTRGSEPMLKELLGMPVGILKDLHQDHEEVSDLFDQMLNMEDAKERAAIFKEVMGKLLVHSEAEQSVLYRKFEKSNDEKARNFAYEGENEHQIVEQQLRMMSRARNKASEQWTAQATVLRELVDHHVKEEESTGFACARKEFGSEQLEKLGDQFRRQKEKLLAEA